MPKTKAGLDFTVRVEGADRVAENLLNMGRRAEDISPVAEDVQAIVGDSNRRRFAGEGFGEWDDLSAATVERKAREGLPDGILIASGDLAHAMSKPDVLKAEGGTILIGTNVEYAHFHDYGTENMPQRKLSKLAPEEAKQLGDVVSKHIVEDLGR
jgi:phage gpG-like protein